MSKQNRRQFLGRSLAAAGLGAGFAIAGTKSSGRILGANDAIRIGVAGLNGRGGSHVEEFGPMKGVEITYLIDPDTRTFAKRIEQLKGVAKGAATPKTVQDIRRALDDPNLDAISVAAPNHWHALLTIWGVQAGKDVYVEKPASHNVHEGRIAVEAARKHNRIVQHGTQSRSSSQWAELAEIAKKGTYGKLLVSRGLCYKPRASIGYKPTGTPPEQVDFNLWLGPAPQQPYHANLVHYNWHWFWDFGNGDIGNQGVHEMDKARWIIPGATLPKSVLSLGGRFGYSDQGETPNTQIAVFDYGDTHLIFEVRGLKTGAYLGGKVGNTAHFEEGVVAPDGGRGALRFYPKGKTDGHGEPLAKVAGAAPRGPGKGHFANFIEAVRSRKTSDLNADILEGHYSAALCHLANISYRLGAPVPFNKETKAFGDDKAAYETLERMEEHLTKDNGLKLDGETYRLGRKLTVDAKTESFVGDAQANALLTRPYRKPFVVPEKITLTQG
jgi:predicted dehydrogenase